MDNSDEANGSGIFDLTLEKTALELEGSARQKQAETLRYVIATQRLEGIEVGPIELAIVARAVAREITHEEAKLQLNELIIS